MIIILVLILWIECCFGFGLRLAIQHNDVPMIKMFAGAMAMFLFIGALACIGLFGEEK